MDSPAFDVLVDDPSGWVDECDVAWPGEFVACDSGGEPLSVQETLLAVELVGPGAEAVRLLSSLRGRCLTRDERLSVLQLWQPQLAWVTGAEQQAVLDLVGVADQQLSVDELFVVALAEFRADAEAAGGEVDEVGLVARARGRAEFQARVEPEFAHLELGPALRLTPAQARRKVAQARLFATRLTATGDALKAGAIDGYRAWLIADATKDLTEAQARQVEASVLPGAAGKTGPGLRRALTRQVRKVDECWQARAFAKARKGRRVVFDADSEPGLVGLHAWLPPVEAVAVAQTLDALAARPGPDADGRTVDERRADALVSCVLGADPADPTRPQPPRVQLQCLVPLSTVLGGAEHPGELAGYGDLPAAVVRELAADADWARWVYDDVTGHLLDQGHHAYRPSRRLDAFIRARDRVDRFPGGTLPAGSCDLDHTIAYSHTEATHCPATDPAPDDDPPDEDPPDDDPPDPPDDPGGGGGTGHGGSGEWPPNRGRFGGAASPDDGRETGPPASAMSCGRSPDRGHVVRTDTSAGGCDPTAHTGGPTSAANLAAVSRNPHRAKTHSGFSARHDAEGTLHWTTPLGRTYPTKPWDYRPD